MAADKDVLRLVPTLQAVALLGHNMKVLKKKKKKVKDMVGLGVTNVVGTSLIKANADFIESY